MGQPIWGSGQTIWVPIQRRVGPFCVRQVYYIRNSKDFHDMRTEFHRINNLHSFFTVLLISHKFPVMSQLLDPLFFLDFFLV